MHELSIAHNIVDIINEHVEAPRRSAVKSVKLRLGEFSGVVSESLDFCFHAVTDGTVLSAANLEIEQVPFTLQCPSCGRSSTNDTGITVCALCGAAGASITGGTEMLVMEIQLNDASGEVS